MKCNNNLDIISRNIRLSTFECIENNRPLFVIQFQRSEIFAQAYLEFLWGTMSSRKRPDWKAQQQKQMKSIDA